MRPKHSRSRALPVLLIGAAASLSLIISSTPAAAVNDPNGHWTQLANHGYPISSSNPACSPCQAWPIGSYHKYYQNLLNGFPGTDAVQAVKDWSALPDRNPVFNPVNQSADLTITAKDLSSYGSGTCGLAQEYPSDSSGTVIGAAALWLTTTLGYTDGPNNSGACDARSALHHEMGHVNSQGHSSVKTDLMSGYPTASNQTVDTIDSDARAGDRAIYGALPGSGNTAAPAPSPTPSPSNSCPRCRFVSLPGVGWVFVPVDPQGIADDTQAIIDYKLGEDVPAEIVPSMQPPPCAGSVQIAHIPLPVCPVTYISG